MLRGSAGPPKLRETGTGAWPPPATAPALPPTARLRPRQRHAAAPAPAHGGKPQSTSEQMQMPTREGQGAAQCVRSIACAVVSGCGAWRKAVGRKRLQGEVGAGAAAGGGAVAGAPLSELNIPAASSVPATPGQRTSTVASGHPAKMNRNTSLAFSACSAVTMATT
jgi:hypothetical protein